MYPPEAIKGAASGTTTYSVWKGGEDLDNSAEFSGNATSDPVSTTVDANSGISSANRKLLNVASTANIVEGDQYLVTNAEGRSEIVTIEGIASGVSVTVDADLAYDYVSGDAFVGLRQYFTVDASFIADENNINILKRPYKVKWSYTVDSVAYVHWTYFDVVRVDVKHNVRGEDLYAAWPELAHSEPVDDAGEAWAPQISEAWRQVAYDLRNDGVDISQVRDDDVNVLLVSKSLLVVAEAGMTPGNFDVETHYSIRERKYQHDLINLVQRMKTDKGRSGVISGPHRRPLFVR